MPIAPVCNSVNIFPGYTSETDPDFKQCERDNNNHDEHGGDMAYCFQA
jgi:hypothetical protein